MTLSDMHTLAGAFAVDALSEHERAQFQRHLGECEACVQEVGELHATAARLGAAVAEDPPIGLKERVLAEIRVTRQQSPNSAPQILARSRGRARAPRWALGLAAAVAVVGLVLAGVFGGIALNTRSQLTAAQEQAAQQRERYAPVAELLGAPDSQAVHGDASVGGGGTVVISRSLNKVMFMGSQLPAHPAGHIYQLWLMSANGPARPAGFVSGGTDDSSPVIAGGLDGSNRVGLSIEQAGGSTTGVPSKDVVLTVPLPA